jgi:hypothetical protein
MYIITQTYEFPAGTTPSFYQTSEDVVAYVLSNYSDKKFGTENETTENPQKLVQIMYWNSQEDYLTYMDDPYIRENLFKPKKRWVIENKIVLTTTYKTIG